MGNQLGCIPPKEKKVTRGLLTKSKTKSMRKGRLEEELLQQQALAMVLYEQQMRFERSSSLRSLTPSSKQGLPRSASARARHVNDPDVLPHQLLKKEVKLPVNLETKHFVLVHGGGYGAWCWYKVIALLEETGCKATAIDLTGSGIDFTDPNNITSLAHYIKPLTEFLEKLSVDEKVILVGHDFGGACISYAMESFSHNIAKAVFLSAAMVTNGQRAFDIFSPEVVTPDDLLPKTQTFIYANGNQSTPTAIEFDKRLLKDLLFNQSPAKDVALATLSIRPIPFAPVLEKLSLTCENYGSVPRYFIQTTEDRALTLAVQENVIKLNPPECVFKLKGSDHSPFLSKPQALHKMLLEIAQIDRTA
eukprot:c20439_g1_i1 orf=332-1417(+)